MIIPSQRRSLATAAALAAMVCGITAAICFARAGLTLSHPDARMHLVVARRIVDNLTPGWRQIGADWLPLAHLINALPIQLDVLYRTGMFAVGISLASFVLAATALAWIVGRATDSWWASGAAVFVFVINPNLLYLQSTPMTEPLMLGVTLLGVAMILEWCAAGESSWTTRPSSIGIVFTLACLTHDEAWAVTAAALAAAVWTRRRSAASLWGSARPVLTIAALPAAAILGGLAFRHLVDGESVASEFVAADNPGLGHPVDAANQVLTGVRSLGGTVTTVVALVGLIGLLSRGLVVEASAVATIALAPAAAALLPWAALIAGNPRGVRDMAPLLAAQAVGLGAAASRWGRATPAAALVLMAIAAVEIGPMFGAAPMTAEAQWDLPEAAARRQVTACLADRYDGTTILASMRSLGHYMQELSREGFQLRDFLHEGNGDIWQGAMEDARRRVGWILIEEGTDGGDVLFRNAREKPEWLEGFSRVCDGGGVALYRRLQLRSVGQV